MTTSLVFVIAEGWQQCCMYVSNTLNLALGLGLEFGLSIATSLLPLYKICDIALRLPTLLYAILIQLQHHLYLYILPTSSIFNILLQWRASFHAR